MALSSGLIANFLLPAVYGITTYGEFIVFNAVLFVVHKTMSIVSEPLIRFHQPDQVLYGSLLLNAFGLGVFLIIRWFFPLGSPWLLLGMLLSLSVVLTMQALMLKKALIIFTSMVNILLLGSIYIGSQGYVALSIQQIMEISTLIPAILGFTLLANHVGRPSTQQLADALKIVVRRMPQLLSMTAVANLFTNALPLLLMGHLSAMQIGQMRVAISVVQSATGIFPVASQAILGAFVRHKDPALLYVSLSRFSAFYFGLLGCTLIIATFILPAIGPYVTLACLLPIFYETILAERYMLAMNRPNELVLVNLGIAIPAAAVLLVAFNLPQVFLVYVTGYALYALLLRLKSQIIQQPWWTSVPVILCPLVVMMALQRPVIGLAFLIGYMLVTSTQGWPKLQDVRLLRNSL